MLLDVLLTLLEIIGIICLGFLALVLFVMAVLFVIAIFKPGATISIKFRGKEIFKKE